MRRPCAARASARRSEPLQGPSTAACSIRRRLLRQARPWRICRPCRRRRGPPRTPIPLSRATRASARDRSRRPLRRLPRRAAPHSRRLRLRRCRSTRAVHLPRSRCLRISGRAPIPRNRTRPTCTPPRRHRRPIPRSRPSSSSTCLSSSSVRPSSSSTRTPTRLERRHISRLRPIHRQRRSTSRTSRPRPQVIRQRAYLLLPRCDRS
jgi:hypothetical protein